jgi:rhodanese-related sulfurtransferase
VVLATSGQGPSLAAAQALSAQAGAQLWQPPGTPDDRSAWTIRLGQTAVQVLATPGHADNAVCVYWEQTVENEEPRPGMTRTEPRPPARTHKRHLFTGLTLLIGDSAPSEPAANPVHQHRSVHEQLFTLPGTTIVWPGRDDHQRSQSTVAVEKSFNPRFASPTPPVPGTAEAMPAVAVRPEAPPQVQPAQGYAGDVPPTLAHEWLQQGEAVMVDVRTDAERAWVGQVPGAVPVAWKQWPGMAENPRFDAELRQAVPPGKKVLLLCRSGVRSVAAARRATELGLEAYNILEGFEGDLDASGHRGQLGGWRRRGLPWQQS